MIERYDTFTVLISSVNRYIKKIKTEKMSEFDLKSTHLSCLHYIYNFNGITAKELCDICKEDKGLISRALVYLEKNGYITYEHTNHRKYRTKLNLTEKGKEVAQKLNQLIDETVLFASDGISESEREVMYSVLKRIDTNLKIMCKNN